MEKRREKKSVEGLDISINKYMVAWHWHGMGYIHWLGKMVHDLVCLDVCGGDLLAFWHVM